MLSLCFALCATRLAHAEPQDADAKRIGGKAISEEYMSGKFAAAQQKLEKAIKTCTSGKCSGKVLAKLYRDLGVVYLGGLNKPKQGKEALARAVQADPNVQLDADLTTPEIAAAFKEVGGEIKGKKGRAAEVEETEEKPEKPKKAKKAGKPEKAKADLEGAEKIELEEEPEQDKPEGAAPAEELAESGDAHVNWFSLSLQQDFLMHKETPVVCNGGDYTCFGPGGVEFTGNIDKDKGNQAAGGFGVATTRVLLGYDRLFMDQILAGARLGLAFGGAPASTLGGKFMPVHIELRGSYFFGDKPFTRTGFRPFAGIAAGAAEVDGHIAVDYFDNGSPGVLDAWRKTGKMFASINAGTQFGLTKASTISAEARLMFMLGTSAIAPAIAIGYVHGL